MLTIERVNDILSEEILLTNEEIRGRRRVYHGNKSMIFAPLSGDFTVFLRDTFGEVEVQYSGPDKEMAVQIFNRLGIIDC